MKSLFILFAAFVMIIATPAAYDALDAARTDSVTENFSSISSSNATANVTLGQALSHNAVSEVVEITSNQTLDTPSASTYDSTSRILLVSGLSSGDARTLAVTYFITSASIPDGMSAFFSILYWGWIVGIMGLIAGAGYSFFQT